MSMPPEYDSLHGDVEASIPWTSEDETLIRFYHDSAKRIKRIVADAASNTPWRQAYLEAQLGEIKGIVEQLKTRQRAWANRELGKEYRKARSQVAQDTGLSVPPFSDIDRETLRVLVESTMAANIEALDSVVPSLEKIFLAARQSIISSEQLQTQISEGLVQGLLPRDIAKNIRQALQTGAETRLKALADTMRPEDLSRLAETAKGNMITIVCRDGKMRHYPLDYYAKMVAKSSRSMAAAEATLRTAVETGMDLVQISVHSGSCPKCVPIQGQVYSISGQTPGFPPLTAEARTPIHPWCGHRMLPVSPEILQAEGSYDNLLKFSNDPEHVVADITDYERVSSGKSIGKPLVAGLAESAHFAEARKAA